jgi:ligand-binding SRPBCC domain-containing protein
MPRLTMDTEIGLPVDRCFDLARDIGLHCRTVAHTRERAVAGVTSGLIGLGETVTFEGVHFGIRQRLTSRVVEFDPPHRFVDEMVSGAFKSLRHTHEFFPIPTGTRMRDTLEWTSPFGPIGALFDALLLKRHMRRFLEARNRRFKEIVEGQG